MRPFRAIFAPVDGVYGVQAPPPPRPPGAAGAPCPAGACAPASGTAASPAAIVVRKSRLCMAADCTGIRVAKLSLGAQNPAWVAPPHGEHRRAERHDGNGCVAQADGDD